MVNLRAKHLSAILTVLLFTFSISVWAAETHCDVCGMTIPDHAKNHLVLKSGDSAVKTLHICSLSCARKARKYDPKLSKAEIADFNHPENMLPGEKTFFLVHSQKIKVDMGEMVMMPYIAGFRTKQEAEVAKAKYGDGDVVESFENGLK